MRRFLFKTIVGVTLAALLLAGGFAAGVHVEWRRNAADAPTPHAGADGGYAALDDEAFGERVRRYILDNPDILAEAASRLRSRGGGDAARDQAAIDANRDALFADPASPVGGDPSGSVSVVEFFDYNCPYCRHVAPALETLKAANPDLRIVYKEFPILGPGSVFAARAALAAHRQDLYEPFHRALMTWSAGLDAASVMQAAAQVGLDTGRLEADMEDPEIARAIEENLALARTMRITGTPGFVIGGHVFRGAADEQTLQALVDRARD